jgi:hypothetical protein
VRDAVVKIYLSVLLVLGAVTMSACGQPFKATVPTGFVELEGVTSSPYRYRAAHPDGLVAAIRVVDNGDTKGSLAFWSRAVENQLRLGKGYRLISQGPAKNRLGDDGTLLKFGHDEGKSPHLYRVALFLKKDLLYVIEQGGTAELVAAHEAELDRFLQDFEPRP